MTHVPSGHAGRARTPWRQGRATILLAHVGLLLLLPARPVSADDRGDRPPAVSVRLLEAPDGGIQPQAAVDDRGTVHLIYFRGDPAAGDLYYARRPSGAGRFSTPIRVNSVPGSAFTIGTVRGGRIALGRKGRVHVAWNGPGRAAPANPNGGSPMLYARLNEEATAFEPQRNVMARTTGLDGGGAVAADRAGNVYVAWHGRTKDAPSGEIGRRVWVARSRDDGLTFAPEEPAIARETGACACCGIGVLADRRGSVYVLFRAAGRNVDRDLFLLATEEGPSATRLPFQATMLDTWRATMCPMSTAALTDAGPHVLTAWETRGEVYFCRVDPQTHAVSRPVAPPGGHRDRKHPAIAGNAHGDVVLVWAEGTGWQKGGALAWQAFDASGRPKGRGGRIERAVPVWGLATVVASPDGGFTIVHSRPGP